MMYFKNQSDIIVHDVHIFSQNQSLPKKSNKPNLTLSTALFFHFVDCCYSYQLHQMVPGEADKEQAGCTVRGTFDRTKINGRFHWLIAV